MIRKTVNTGLLLCIVLVMLLSCQQTDESFKVGLLMDDLIQERWTKDRDLLIKEVEKLGGTVFTEVAKGDGNLQIEQARNLLMKGATILIVIPVNLETAAQIVVDAHERNVKVIAYDRLIKNCDLDFYVSFDNVQVGAMQASEILKQCKQGKYALINGPTDDNNVFLLKLGQLSILQPAVEKNEIELVYDEFVERWNIDQGYMHMKKCMEKNNDSVDAVIAGNDDLARGAIKYILEKDSTFNRKICFAGQDADLKACQNIVAGMQTMTVYKPIKDISRVTAEVAYQLVTGEKIEFGNITSINNNKKMVPAILLAPQVVYADNIRETVIQDGYLKEDQIYQ